MQIDKQPKHFKYTQYGVACVLIFLEDYELIKPGHQCKSSDTLLGKRLRPFSSVERCANICRKIEGCKYFVVENDGGFETCWRENTTSSSCPEGWESSAFDFYKLKGKL